jgi:hypothetical protein
MKSRPFLLLPLALLAGCETTRPYAPVENVRYTAIGHDPFWLLTIGDDRIVLRLGHDGGEAAEEFDEVVFPRTLPRTVDGVRTWQSGDIPSITVEARPTPCTNRTGQVFEDQVRVRWTTHQLVPEIRTVTEELTGCGGRLVRSAED